MIIIKLRTEVLDVVRSVQLLSNGSILILIIGLIQWHSIQFWMSITGEIGILWSIVIEAAGLWLWWQRQTLLACTASFILIAGPLLGLAIPLQKTITQNQTNILQHDNYLASTEKVVNQLQTSLDSYQLTSQIRTGWASRIDNTQHELNVANRRFDQLIKDTPTPQNILKAILIISIEALALLVLLLTQILAIGKLRNVSNISNNIETPHEAPLKRAQNNLENKIASVLIVSKDTKKTNTDIETLALEISKQLEKILRDEGISQAEWARRNDVSAKNVSLLRNYSKRKKKGLECIPEKEILRMNRIIM